MVKETMIHSELFSIFNFGWMDKCQSKNLFFIFYQPNEMSACTRLMRACICVSNSLRRPAATRTKLRSTCMYAIHDRPSLQQNFFFFLYTKQLRIAQNTGVTILWIYARAHLSSLRFVCAPVRRCAGALCAVRSDNFKSPWRSYWYKTTKADQQFRASNWITCALRFLWIFFQYK